MSSPPSAVRILAPAKVNLTLSILGRRPDGFHELDTLFQAIALHDVLDLAPASGPGVELVVEGADVGPVRENLVWRAATALLAATGRERTGVRIELLKRIPAGAGLGGGSSDAAATLRGLVHLLDLRVSDDTLRELAAELGSDVPFFIGPSGLARGTGRGERIEALDPLPARALVLGLPDVTCATAAMYGELARRRAERAIPAAPAPPPPASWQDVFALARNDFELIAVDRHRVIAAALDALRARGLPLAMLSGSGSAVFAVAHDAAEAAEVASALNAEVAGVRFVASHSLETLPGPGVAIGG